LSVKYKIKEKKMTLKKECKHKLEKPLTNSEPEEEHFYMATQASRRWTYLFKCYDFHFVTHCKKCGKELVLSKVLDWGYADYDTCLIYRCPNSRWWKVPNKHTESKFHVVLLKYNIALKELKNKGK